MDGFGWLISLAGFVLALIALNKISRLDTRIAQLKLQVGQLSDQLSGAAPAPQESPKTEKKKSNWPTAAVAAAKSPEPVLAETPTPELMAQVAKTLESARGEKAQGTEAGYGTATGIPLVRLDRWHCDCHRRLALRQICL